MSIPVVSFPILSFDQANPALAGAQRMANLIQTNLAARGQQYQNQIAAAQAQYAPQMTQAQLQSLQEKTAMLPYQAAGQYLTGIGKAGMASYYNNPGNQLARVLNTPAMESYIANNPEGARNVMTALAAGAQRAAASSGQPTSQIPSGLTLQDIMKGGGMPQQQPQMMAQQQQPQQQPISDAAVAQMQNTLGNILEKRQTTAQMLNQRQYANVLDNLFTTADSLMPAVVQYAGVAGKGQKGLDALASAFGNTSPTYSAYLKFSRSAAPILANEMRRTLGGQATDKEATIMNNLSDPTWIDSNPQQAIDQFNFLKSIYRNSVNPALAMGTAQARQNLQRPAPSQDDLEFTAKKYGISVDEVKRRLGM